MKSVFIRQSVVHQVPIPKKFPTKSPCQIPKLVRSWVADISIFINKLRLCFLPTLRFLNPHVD